MSQLTGNQRFLTGGVTLRGVNPNFTTFDTQAFGNGIRIDFDAAANRYTLTNAAGATQTFGPEDFNRNLSQPGSSVWGKNNGVTGDSLQIIDLIINNVRLSYTEVLAWTRLNVGSGVSDTQLAVRGVPTIASDMPRTGTAIYNADGGGNVFSGGQTFITATTSTYTFSANFGTEALSTTLRLLAGRSGVTGLTDFGTATGTGSITSGTSAFTGTLTMPDRTGSFSGSFFGPQAVEMAYAWYLAGAPGSGFSAGGWVWGIKR